MVQNGIINVTDQFQWIIVRTNVILNPIDKGIDCFLQGGVILAILGEQVCFGNDRTVRVEHGLFHQHIKVRQKIPFLVQINEFKFDSVFGEKCNVK